MKSFFGTNSPYFNHPLLTEERTLQEVNFVLNHLMLPEGGKVLDIGCGFGRHSLELARRGYQPIGIDFSPAMIEAARISAVKANLQIEFEVMDARHLTFAQIFDGAICLFTTLGQVSEDQNNFALLKQVAQVLKPGARLIVEIPHKPWLVTYLKAEDKFGNDLNYTHVQRHFDPETSRVTELFTVVSGDSQTHYHLQYQLLAAETLLSLLDSAGLTAPTLFSDYRGSPFIESCEDDAIIIALAEQ